MSTWVTVWFVVGIISAAGFAVCVTGLVKHLLILRRTVHVLQEEMAPVTAALSAGLSRASATSSNLKPPTDSRR